MNSYTVLQNQIFKYKKYSLIPIRYEDRFKIMQWRNEQMYHLRQTEPLTFEKQEEYFLNIISKLFNQKEPPQILFSYLENNICIGYGGLVHINWVKSSSEISFVLNTDIEKNNFESNWEIFINLIEIVAFEELKLNKIYTHAFDVRPKLYKVLERCGYKKEKILEKSYSLNNIKLDTVIHSKFKNENIKK